MKIGSAAYDKEDWKIEKLKIESKIEEWKIEKLKTFQKLKN